MCMLSGLGGGGWWVLKLCQGVTGASVCLWVKGRRGDKVVRILCLTKISPKSVVPVHKQLYYTFRSSFSNLKTMIRCPAV